MKSILITLILTLMTVTPSFNQNKTTLSTNADSISYSLGVSFASQILPNFPQLNLDIVLQAMKDVYGKKPTLIDASQAGQILNKYIQEQQAIMAEALKAGGVKFLEENKKREGVVTLPSGLQYQILKQGSGPIPTRNDQVKVHYEGRLIDGSVFDSSVERGQPATFGVTQVIQGWVEALQLMPEGSKWQLYIPSDLAYGPRGTGSIPGYAVLIFDVELLEVIRDQSK